MFNPFNFTAPVPAILILSIPAVDSESALDAAESPVVADPVKIKLGELVLPAAKVKVPVRVPPPVDNLPVS